MKSATVIPESGNPTFTYLYDNRELNVLPITGSGSGPSSGDGVVFLNNFITQGGYSTITHISAAWFRSEGTDQAVVTGIWADPNQDGNPDDARLLGSSALKLVISAVQTEQFFPLQTPVDVGLDGTSFFVGVFWWNDPNIGSRNLSLEKTPRGGEGSSWIRIFKDTPPEPENLLGVNRQLGSHPAYSIRAIAVIPEPTTWLLVTFASLVFLRRRSAR